MKRHLPPFVPPLCVLTAISLLAAVFLTHTPNTVPTVAPITLPHTVVIDAGHGGEDGGALSEDGSVAESGINLAIARDLNDLLQFLGCDTVMTRTEDVSIYSGDAKTLRQKKVSDLKNRVALVNAQEDAILISIHQNSLPSFRHVRGAQVFHGSVGTSDAFAASVQAVLNETVNDKAKEYKAISDTIYLMKNVNCPAILVECGFLSNGGETQKLQDPAYQRMLAVSIAAGYRNVNRGGEHE